MDFIDWSVKLVFVWPEIDYYLKSKSNFIWACAELHIILLK